MCNTFLDKVEGKKSKGKKSKGTEGGKKKAKPQKNKTDKEKAKAKAEEDNVNDNKNKLNEAINATPPSEKQENAKVIKKSKPTQRTSVNKSGRESSSSRSSSRSFSVSRSPSPSNKQQGRKRSPVDLNAQRSPREHSPPGYPDYRQRDVGRQHGGRRSYERDDLRGRPPPYQEYGPAPTRYPPRPPPYYQRRETYPRGGSRYNQYDRGGPQPTRRSPPPPGYYQRDEMRRRGDYAQGRHIHPDDNYADTEPGRGRRQPSPQQLRQTSPNNRKEREESRSRSPPDAARSHSKPSRSATGNYSSKELRQEEHNLGRNSQSDARRHHRGKARDPSCSPSSASPDKRRTLTSSIGAVISHESDGEYNPERMLKKSIVASQVS